MHASPRPVEPAAPTVLSQYWPAPMIGESPTRPATFHERPDVVVTELMSPEPVTAHMLIVPYVYGTPALSRQTWLYSSRCASGGRGRSSQLSLGLRRAFQFSQSWRLFSVRRFCV